MRMPKADSLLVRVGMVLLLCGALILSGCARFDGVVDFDATPTSGRAPLSVQFTPVVEGGIRRCVWSFGDGHTSTERSPEHTYAEPGLYTVILTVDPRRGDRVTASKEDCITVTAGLGGTSGSLAAQDDDFNLSETSSYRDPWGRLVYVLDVLDNDAPGLPTGDLTILGVRAYWDTEYDSGPVDTSDGEARVVDAGKKIEYAPYTYGPSDDFFYLVSDGRETAEAKVSVTDMWITGHP